MDLELEVRKRTYVSRAFHFQEWNCFRGKGNWKMVKLEKHQEESHWWIVWCRWKAKKSFNISVRLWLANFRNPSNVMLSVYVCWSSEINDSIMLKDKNVKNNNNNNIFSSQNYLKVCNMWNGREQSLRVIVNIK